MPKKLDNPESLSLSDIHKMSAEEKDAWFGRERSKLVASAERILSSPVIQDRTRKQLAVANGDEAFERILIEMHHETGLTVNELADMDAIEFDRYVAAAMRRRGVEPDWVKVKAGDIAGGRATRCRLADDSAHPGIRRERKPASTQYDWYVRRNLLSTYLKPKTVDRYT
ncbi:hypothetical protein V7x_24710 [Crateriforma conspicua]|uniref:Uncharacterized protein n=1 Tax=Crateriforma conspicua TaxID=2527996 RepID=A0A5C6G022_9PLAN|nr:hypothetical protein [Crateriforma conspicua]TWU66900.1 hypothetical protein V7x_24710 [Crateriforma conspicua]